MNSSKISMVEIHDVTMSVGINHNLTQNRTTLNATNAPLPSPAAGSIGESASSNSNVNRLTIPYAPQLTKTKDVVFEDDMMMTMLGTQSIEQPIVFDSFDNVFDFGRFFFQLLIHITNPLLNLATNWRTQRLFLSGTTFDRSTNLFSTISVVLMIVFYAETNRLHSIVHGAIEIPLLLFSIHKVMVAFRYGSLNDIEYYRIMRSSGDLARLYISQTELIAGWLYFVPGVWDFFILAASIRVGVNISHLHFTLPDPNTSSDADINFQRWLALLRLCGNAENDEKKMVDANGDVDLTPGMSRNSDGTYNVCAYQLCLSIITLANKRVTIHSTHSLWRFIAAVTILNAILPFMLHFSKMSTINASHILFFVFSTYINVLYYPLLLVFLMACWVDVNRQAEISSIVADLMRVKDYASEQPIEIESQWRRQISNSNPPDSTRTMDGGQSSNNPMVHNQNQSDSSVSPKLRKKKGSLNSDLLDAPIHQVLRHSEAIRASRSAGTTAESTPAIQNLVVPRLDLSFCPNITNWVYLRTILQNFGDRFRLRINYFVVALILLIGIFMAIAIFLAVDATNVRKTIISTYFLQSLLISSTLICFLLLFTKTSADGNAARGDHRMALTSHQLRVRRMQDLLLTQLHDIEIHVSSHPQDEYMCKKEHMRLRHLLRTYEESAACLEVAQTSVDMVNGTAPFKVLGITADNAMVSTMFSVAIGFYSTLVSLWSQSRNQFLKSEGISY